MNALPLTGRDGGRLLVQPMSSPQPHRTTTLRTAARLLAILAWATHLGASPTTFPNWLAAHGLTGTNDTAAQLADPDGDGASNIVEYAWDTDPASATSRPATAVECSGPAFSATFPRDPAKTDLAYHIETSSDLCIWFIVARSVYGRPLVNLGGASSIGESGGNPRLATTWIDAATGAPSQGFARVRLSYKEQRPAPGLLWPDGIEPGDPATGEAPVGRRNWWVDSAAPAGGDGSHGSPFNSFEVVEDAVRGGDFIYVRGVFDMATHSSGHRMTLNLYRAQAGGSPDSPTTVKSWRGSPRAVFDSRRTSAQLRASNSAGLRFQNLELRNFGDQGIVVGDGVTYAEMVNLVIHDGQVTAGSGIGGGLVMYAADSRHIFVVRHCEIFSTPDDNPGNNSGAFSVISEPSAHAGSSVVVRHCLFHDNHIAVRHKHAGRVHMEASDNRFEDNAIGFYLRMWTSEAHHNLFVRNGTAFQLDSDNMNANHDYRLHHNTLYDTNWLASTMPDQGGFVANLHLEDNLFLDPTPGDGVIRIGSGDWNWGANDLSGWTSARNLFLYTPDTRPFLHSAPPTAHLSRDFADALTQLGDTTSRRIDPRLENPAGDDFTLRADSPAIGAAADGGDVGAF
ncbi:MAG: right-handed parallel beta-helix repeat-containing protein [Opitutaceae bacterium]|nr:right-handed parallel beta-helix repeat-containing protein [Opitutaceae bacterium]